MRFFGHMTRCERLRYMTVGTIRDLANLTMERGQIDLFANGARPIPHVPSRKTAAKTTLGKPLYDAFSLKIVHFTG